LFNSVTVVYPSNPKSYLSSKRVKNAKSPSICPSAASHGFSGITLCYELNVVI
jgi:hypothetical protein